MDKSNEELRKERITKLIGVHNLSDRDLLIVDRTEERILNSIQKSARFIWKNEYMWFLYDDISDIIKGDKIDVH